MLKRQEAAHSTIYALYRKEPVKLLQLQTTPQEKGNALKRSPSSAAAGRGKTAEDGEHTKGAVADCTVD
jgi:hypothetical protein